MARSSHEGNRSQTHLWGYYDVHLDLEAQTAAAALNRNAMYAVNVVIFLNNNPPTLGFVFNGVDKTPDYVDVDLDVSITHPIPSKPKFNGYDVRGILICEGSEIMDYSSDLRYQVDGSDQYLINADGYTRWFNRPEFTNAGLFGYTHGVFASKNLLYGDATVNPYKHFADGLLETDDLWTFLNDNIASNGVFSSGSTNTRNYLIRFPLPTPAIQYGYAIAADWQGGQPGDHPSNAFEAVGCDVSVTDDIYYVGPSDNGGNLILDFSLFGWDDLPSAIFIQSTVLSAVHELTPTEMNPVATGDNYATWHVDIPADDITGTEGNEYWIIAEYGAHDYNNPFGVPNAADTDPLAAFYRHNLFVADHPYNLDPVCDMTVVTPMPVEGWAPLDVEFDASGSSDPDGDTLTFEWDFNGDGVFGDSYTGSPENPTHGYMLSYTGQVCVKVTDGRGGEDTCCDVVEVIIVPNSDPICDMTVVTPMPVEGWAPLNVEFDASGSFDPDGDTLTFEWDFNDDGVFGDSYTGSPENPTHGYMLPYTGQVCVKVTDGKGGEDTCCDAVEVIAFYTLCYYDGEVDNGGITGIPGFGANSWTYCPDTHSWDENECGPYFSDNFACAKTDIMTFPPVGTFTTIHLEIWHWGDMQDDGACYGSLGVVDFSSLPPTFEANRNSERLVYIEGFDFNDNTYADWSLVFGSESSPEWSHFDCSDYAGERYAIGFKFEEFGAGNPLNQAGWNIRKLWVWVEP